MVEVSKRYLAGLAATVALAIGLPYHFGMKQAEERNAAVLQAESYGFQLSLNQREIKALNGLITRDYRMAHENLRQLLPGEPENKEPGFKDVKTLLHKTIETYGSSDRLGLLEALVIEARYIEEILTCEDSLKNAFVFYQDDGRFEAFKMAFFAEYHRMHDDFRTVRELHNYMRSIFTERRHAKTTECTSEGCFRPLLYDERLLADHYLKQTEILLSYGSNDLWNRLQDLRRIGQE
jgi:hypothetical protein